MTQFFQDTSRKLCFFNKDAAFFILSNRNVWKVVCKQWERSIARTRRVWESHLYPHDWGLAIEYCTRNKMDTFPLACPPTFYHLSPKYICYFPWQFCGYEGSSLLLLPSSHPVFPCVVTHSNTERFRFLLFTFIMTWYVQAKVHNVVPSLIDL